MAGAAQRRPPHARAGAARAPARTSSRRSPPPMWASPDRQYRRDARRQDRRHLFRHVGDRRTGRACAARDRGRQACLPGKADRRTPAGRDGDRTRPRRPPASRPRRCRTRSPAGLPQAAQGAHSGFFERILSARLDSGWWVFDTEPCIRRSAQAGTTERRTAADSCSTCIRTGATC